MAKQWDAAKAEWIEVPDVDLPRVTGPLGVMDRYVSPRQQQAIFYEKLRSQMDPNVEVPRMSFDNDDDLANLRKKQQMNDFHESTNTNPAAKDYK